MGDIPNFHSHVQARPTVIEEPPQLAALRTYEEYQRQQQTRAKELLKIAAPDRAASIEIDEMARDFALTQITHERAATTRGPDGLTMPTSPFRQAELQRPDVAGWAQAEYPMLPAQVIEQTFNERVAYTREAVGLVRLPPAQAAQEAKTRAADPASRAKLGQAIVDVMMDERFAGAIAPQQRTFWQNFGENMLRGAEDIGRMVDIGGQMLAGERASAPLERIARQAAETADPARSKDAGLLERGVMAGARSIPFTAGGVAAAIAAGVPGALAFTASQTIPDAFDEYSGRGVDGTTARVAAVTTGAIEAVFEQWMPFDRLVGLKGVGGVGFRDTLKKIVADRAVAFGKENAEEFLQRESRSIFGALAEKGFSYEAMRQVAGELPTFDELAETAIAVGTTMGPSAAIQTGREIATQGFDARDRSKAFKDWMLTGPGADFLVNDNPGGAAAYAAKPNPSSKDLAELLGVPRRAGWSLEERTQLARNLRERQAAGETIDVAPDAAAEMAETDRKIKSGEIDTGNTFQGEDEPPAPPPQTPPQPAAQAAPVKESPSPTPEPRQEAVIAPQEAPAETAPKPAEEVADEIQGLLGRLENDEWFTDRDFVNELEAVEDLPDELADAVKNYREARRVSEEEFGDRMDLGGDAIDRIIEVATRLAGKPAAPAKPKAAEPDEQIDLEPLRKATTVAELDALAGRMLSTARTAKALQAIQVELKKRTAELETPATPPAVETKQPKTEATAAADEEYDLILNSLRPATKEELERIRPLLRALWPEVTEQPTPPRDSDFDYGIWRMANKGDEAARVPTVDLNRRIREARAAGRLTNELVESLRVPAAPPMKPSTMDARKLLPKPAAPPVVAGKPKTEEPANGEVEAPEGQGQEEELLKPQGSAQPAGPISLVRGVKRYEVQETAETTWEQKQEWARTERIAIATEIGRQIAQIVEGTSEASRRRAQSLGRKLQAEAKKRRDAIERWLKKNTPKEERQTKPRRPIKQMEALWDKYKDAAGFDAEVFGAEQGEEDRGGFVSEGGIAQEQADFSEFVIRAGTEQAKSSAEEIRRLLPPELRKRVRLVKVGSPSWKFAKEWEDTLGKYGPARIAASIIAAAKRESGSAKADTVAQWLLANREWVDPVDVFQAFRYQQISGAGTAADAKAATKARPKVVKIDDLVAGQTFTVAGDPHTVTEVDENGAVTIVDGMSGEYYPGDGLAIDKKSLSDVKADDSFSVDEFEADPAEEEDDAGPEGAFRAFVEAKGVDWKTVKVGSKVRADLRADFDAQQAGKPEPTEADRAWSEAREARDKLSEWMQGNSFSNPVFDPTFYKIIGEIIQSHVRAGIVTFKGFYESMAKKYGLARAEKMRPGLIDAWNAARLTNDAMDEPPPRFGEYGEKEPTSIKNAVVERERKKRGLPSAMEPARRGFGVVWDEAMAKVAADPSYQDVLIAELAAKARAVTDLEDALLLHRQIVLQNEYMNALEALDAGKAANDDVAVAKADQRLETLRGLLEQLYDVNKAVGTATGRGLAARKMLAYEDFTLAKMLMEKRAATGAKTLDKDAAEEVRKAQERIAELEKALQDSLLKNELLEAEKAADSAIDELKGEVKAEKKGKPKPAKGQKAVSAARAEADAALADFKKKLAALATGTTSSLAGGAGELLASGVALVKAYVKLGMKSIGQLIDTLKTEMGAEFTPDFEKNIRAAWDEYRRSNIDLDDISDLSKVARALAKQHIRDGVTGRDEILEKVWEDLKTALPELTRRETMDAISLYGQYKELDKDAVKVRLRQIAGELQQLAKLEDMAGGKAPLLTGQERRKPTDEERRLIKEVNEAKKRGGFIVTDPDRQLRTALNALETRLTNAIKDLEWEIANKQKIVKQKTGVPTSPKIEELRKRRDELKERRDAIFGKPGKSDAQKLKEALAAKDRAIAEWQRRIDERDFGPRTKKPGISDPSLDLKQAELDAVKAQYAELESLRPDDKGQVSEYRAVTAYWRSLARQRERYIQRLAAGDFAPKPKKPPRMDKKSRDLRGKLELEKNKWRQGGIDARRARRTPFEKFSEIPIEFVRVSRAMVTAMDFSGVLRQGGLLAGAHPILAAKALPEMFRAFASEEALMSIEAEIADRMNAKSGLDVRAGLELTGIHGTLTNMEEAYRSVWIEMIAAYASSGKPGAAKLAAKAFNATIGGSERAYVAFLNILRASVFDHLVAQLGDPDTVSDAEARIIANFVNVATGRGDIGKFKKSAEMLAEVFFAPRWVWSRFQYLTLQPLRKDLGKGTWRVRHLIAKEYAKSLGALGVFYGTAALALTALLGAMGSPDDPESKWSIEMDPRSSDFGKIRIGRTRIDALAGLGQTAVFLTRSVFGEMKTRHGEIKNLRQAEWFDQDMGDIGARFLRSKLSPVFGAAIDIFTGQTYDYQPTTISSVARNLITPLAISDIADAMKEQGIPAGTAIGLATIFGLSVQTYAPDKPLEKLPQFPSRKEGETEENYRMRVGAWGRKIDVQPADTREKLRREFLQNKVWQAAENPFLKRQAGEPIEKFNQRKADRAQEISDAKSLLGERSTSELVALLREEALSRKESVRVWDSNGKMTAFGQRQARLIRLSREARQSP